MLLSEMVNRFGSIVNIQKEWLVCAAKQADILEYLLQ